MRNATEIIFLLDRSGSMDTIRDDVIGGYNRFISDQKALEGEAYMTLVMFDSFGRIDTVYEHVNIQDVQEMTRTEYCPTGMTALLQAMSITIDRVGKRLEALPEEERPDKVIMVIMTDGEENHSGVEYTKAMVFDKVTHQTDVYKWTFLFPGANQDAIKEGTGLGVRDYWTLTYQSDSKGTDAVYSAISNAVSSYRSVGDVGNWQDVYTEEMSKG